MLWRFRFGSRRRRLGVCAGSSSFFAFPSVCRSEEALGIGSGAQVLQTPFGPRRISGAELDEEMLERVASMTGGRYFRARDTRGLLDVLAAIDVLEPSEGENASVRPIRALFFWPLGLALALVMALWLRRLWAEVAAGVGAAGRSAEAARGTA